MVSSLLNVVYLLSIPVRGFFPAGGGAPAAGEAQAATGIKEAPVPCLVAIGVSAFGCLVLFFYPEPVYNLMLMITAP
jgi:multicomponent Na+:H+ antiporter subunit D